MFGLTPTNRTRKASDGLELFLRDRPEDEKSGAHAMRGFAFQHWWATLKIVELLALPDDFAVGVEFKEDIAILNSACAPTRVEFCQIKKHERAGAWALKDLYKPGRKLEDGTRSHSILAKLYSRRAEFESGQVDLRFVSNVGVRLPNEAGKLSEAQLVELSTLEAEQQVPLQAAISTQLGVPEATVDLSRMFLFRTELPLERPHLFVGGLLAELSASGLLNFQLTQTSVAARALAMEIQQRATSTAYARTFSELKLRMVSRSEAVNVLADVAQLRESSSTILDNAIAELEREGYPFVIRRGIKEQRVLVCADATDRTNMFFGQVERALERARALVEPSIGEKATLGNLMDEVVAEARVSSPADCVDVDLSYMRAVALLVLSNAAEPNPLIAPPGKESKEEK